MLQNHKGHPQHALHLMLLMAYINFLDHMNVQVEMCVAKIVGAFLLLVLYLHDDARGKRRLLGFWTFHHACSMSVKVSLAGWTAGCQI